MKKIEPLPRCSNGEFIDFLKQVADYCETFNVGDGFATLIISKKTEGASCMFGNVKMPQSFDDAATLFQLLEKKTIQLGYHTLTGPIDYCSWFSYRWAIDNFDFQIFPDCDNTEMYVKYINQLGYQITQLYRSAVVSLDNPIALKGKNKYKKLCKEGIDFTICKGRDVMPMAQELFTVSTLAFQHGLFYAPISFEIFEKFYLRQLALLDVDIIIAKDNNKIIGYVLGYSDPVHSSQYIAKTSAVLPSYQTRGIYSAMLYLATQLLKKRGYKQYIFHYQNVDKKTFRHFDKKIETKEKHYAVFSKQLKGSNTR